MTKQEYQRRLVKKRREVGKFIYDPTPDEMSKRATVRKIGGGIDEEFLIIDRGRKVGKKDCGNNV